MSRFSITVVIALWIPAFAAAQHRGGGFASAPVSAGRAAPMISRGPSVGPHAYVRAQSGTRIGSTVVRTRTGGRVIHHNNGTNFGFNNAFNNGFNNGPNFSDVPGLGFDYPHLAAVSGNRRFRNGGFGVGFPFGFGGYLLNPPVIADEGALPDSQIAEDDSVDDAPPQQYAPRRPRAPRPPSEPQAESAPAPLPDAEQYVFVRRDGSLVFAVAYAWDNSTLRYVTPDGLRHSIGRDALDLKATQQFNEQRGIDFRIPA
jgi:hypothetical protein